MYKKSDKANYNTQVNDRLKDLKTQWQDLHLRYREVEAKFKPLHLYIYMLVKKEKYSKAEIARFLEISEVRVGYIVNNIEKSLRNNRKGVKTA